MVENSPTIAGDIKTGFSPGPGKSYGGQQGSPLQYSCLENPMDRGAWRATVHRVAKSQTWLKWLSTCACVPGTVLTSPALSYFVFTKSCPVFPYFSNGKPKACNLELLLGSAPANWVIFQAVSGRVADIGQKENWRGKWTLTLDTCLPLCCALYIYIYMFRHISIPIYLYLHP